jgi:hypothetical protein
MNKYVKATLLLVLSFSFISCSFFAKDPIKIAVLPIVFNVDERALDDNSYTYPEKKALAEAKKLYELNFNLEFQILNSVYTTDPLEFTCSWWEPPPRVDIESTIFINQCYERLIVLIYIHRNMSTNLLGCAPLSGILRGNTTLFLYLEESDKNNVETLEHELAHILGADHTEDGSLMSPAQSEVILATFSDETKDQINEILDSLE